MTSAGLFDYMNYNPNHPPSITKVFEDDYDVKDTDFSSPLSRRIQIESSNLSQDSVLLRREYIETTFSNGTVFHESGNNPNVYLFFVIIDMGNVHDNFVLPLENKITSEQKIDQIFANNCNQTFEPGMDSEFTKELQSVFDQAPHTVLQSLPEKLIEYRQYNEILCETLEWLRRQDNTRTHNDICSILTTALKHESRYVRDIAASELAEIDGEFAKGPISEAIENEVVPALKKDLIDILESL